MSSFASLASEIDVDAPSQEQRAPIAAKGGFADLANEIDVNAPVVRRGEAAGGYLDKISSGMKSVANAAIENPGSIKPGILQAGAAMITGAPVALLKHGVEEGAYLSGQSPDDAAATAQRVVPTDGYQPTLPIAKAITDTAGAIGQPLVDAGRWVADKIGLSPAAQNLAGDFARVAIPKSVSATSPIAGRAATALTDRIANSKIGQGAANISALAKDIGSRGSLPEMQARYAELVKAGKTPDAVPTGPTPQQLRGQEPMPPQPAPEAAAADIPITPRRYQTEAVPPQPAPAITVENASPAIKEAIKQQGPTITEAETVRHLEADSLPVQIRLSKGQASGDLHQLSDEFNRRGMPQGKALADLFREQNGKLIENVNAIRDKAAPAVNALDHVENGETLINAYAAKDAALKADISAKYKALEDANGGQFPLDGKGFVDAADAALAKKLKSHYVPPEVRSTLNDLRKGEAMTFEDFETLRSDLAETARSAQDGKVRAAANIIRQQLEDLPMPQGAEHLKPLADAARSAAKVRFDLLDADPAYKAAVTDAVPADKFVQRYIINGNKADLSTMRDNLVADPVAQQSISAAAINYLKSRAGIVNDNGNFSQSGYNKALASIEPKIDYLFDPITAQQIKTLGNVARYTQEQPRGSYFNNSGTAVMLMKDAATAGAEGVLNAKTYGGYSGLKSMIKSAKNAKAAEAAANPLGPLNELR